MLMSFTAKTIQQVLVRNAAILGHRHYAASTKQAAVKWPTILFKAATERGAVRTNARKASGGARRRREELGSAGPAVLTDDPSESGAAGPDVLTDNPSEADAQLKERRVDSSQASTSGRTPEQAFLTLGVDDRLLGRLHEMGIREPTQVQEASIGKVLRGDNIAIQCYTGSGKTLAYLLPVLSMALQRAEAEFEALAAQNKSALAGSLQAVVVVPSRELAMQIARVGQSLLPHQARGCVQQAIGGANINRQVEAIKQNKPLMVVGTPGRLAELSRSGALQTHPAGILVLDEVDQLLAVQFREDMTRLTEHVGRKASNGRQTILVSATLTQNVLVQCEKWCPKAEAVFSSVQAAQPGQQKKQQPTSPSAPQWGWDDLKFSAGDTLNPATQGSAGGVGTADAMPLMPPQLEHGWLLVDRRHRVDAVRRVIHALNSHRALVFMNFQQRLNDTKYKLEVHKMSVGTLSGDMGKTERANVLRQFARGDFRALIVSDVAARGLDLPDCDAVINLELPSDASHYAHRAGRTGRAGRDGVVVSLAESSESFVMQKLARRLGVPIPELRIQGGVIEPIPSEPAATAAAAGAEVKK
ncbi:hypothetical protein WJX75_002476 [Coccomyxa subellipsoidea]|uniref:P-loop containing nucleoside triphosphate hydrolase protein n=1 Tax=Coccomyxa subellipsoidea TaxID=248742 RepID=A0ABR2Z237_9CHLO